MRCHPAFAAYAIPPTGTLGRYRLDLLGPDHVDEDYAVVMESAGRLAGAMGGTWPAGLTLEANRVDLCWHAKEFAIGRSFAWIVRDGAGRYVGCLYVYPSFDPIP